MKLDIDFIRILLAEIEAGETSEKRFEYLVKDLDINMDDTIQAHKITHHIEMMCDAHFVKCKSDGYGFKRGLNDDLVHWNAPYSLTLVGYQLLESMQNDSLWQKIKQTFKEIGINELKKTPGLCVSLLLKNMSE